jgi:hypothetical protein
MSDCLGPPQPYQLHNLRLSLASLYSLHPPSSPGSHHNTGGSGRPTTQQAHDFLLQFQSRNVRRKIQSQKQPCTVTVVDPNDVGSTWLANVALLCRFVLGSGGGGEDNSHYSNIVTSSEALFAAQTLSHRLRRIKLSEAVDVEMEPNPELPVEQQQNHVLQLQHQQQVQQQQQQQSTPQSMDSMQVLETYRNWSRCLHPMLSPMVHNYHPQESADEECIKGELAMITIAAIIYCITASQYQHPHPHHQHGHDSSPVPTTRSSLRPLISTLGSALAVIAARLRYISQSLPHPAPHTQFMVVMILQSLQFARDTALQQPHQQPNDALLQRERIIYAHVVYACLAAIPDGLLTGCSGGSGDGGGGGGGGAHGRISMDPRCFRAVTTELRLSASGCSLVWRALMDLHLPSINGANNINMPQDDVCLIVLFLTTCEQWAKYVALPLELVHATVPLINQAFGTANPTVGHHVHQHTNSTERQSLPPVASAAMAYWIALVEAGTWTVEQILTASLMQPNEASQQPNKKRQTSRSKKRNKEELDKRTTNDVLDNAQAEVAIRGQVACQTAMMTWERFRPILTAELHAMAVRCQQSGGGDEDDEVPGDGPINGITACANACLPTVLRQSVQVLHRDTSSGGSTASNGSNTSSHQSESSLSSSLQLFVAIAQGVQEICSSPLRIVRAFAAETLYTLHAALLEVVASYGPLPGDFEAEVANHFFRVRFSTAWRV